MIRLYWCLPFFFLALAPLQGETDCQELLSHPEPIISLGGLRIKALKSWDRLLTWALAPKNQPYKLLEPAQKVSYHVEGASLPLFKKNYGYFSSYRPIFGMRTDLRRDLKVAKCLLAQLPVEVSDRDQLLFSAYEVLTKVVSLRNLKVGDTLFLPEVDVDGNVEMAEYTLDLILDLWHAMPAFGFISKEGKSPFLLFRGTDLTFTSEKGWASFLSDLDPKGAGLTTFLRGHTLVRKWLEERFKEENPARVVGYSLGGAFALYTLAYDYDLLLNDPKHPSLIFNAPGVPESILTRWNRIPSARRPHHTTFINEGDVVSQVGYLIGNVWAVSLGEEMGVLEAHLTLISAEETFHLTRVDVAKENLERASL